ncbi:MAG TPA: DUF1800 domain-containing protein [Bryobacteraceae bacterium]|nr:DUF1800 domain-containing protein [Bryobacteraceae bacterium]
MRLTSVLTVVFFLIWMAPVTPAAEGKQLSEEQKIVHVLNRLGYGPRPGDIEKVRKMGVRAYIDQQLHPERIPDVLAARRLSEFKSLKLNGAELETAYPVVSTEGLRARGNAVRMEPTEKPLPPPGSKAVAPTPVQPNLKNDEDERLFRQKTRMEKPGEYELVKARLVRAVYSERQLLEMMVDFWFNHFNIFGRNGEAGGQDYEEHAIRPHALGKFEDLLKATAQHPAMLMYLDNWRSSAPVEVLQQRLGVLNPSLSGPERRVWRQMAVSVREMKGLNENYGRELMELHTLGVEGGYTQQDVIQVAKCFTGWTVSEWNGDGTRSYDHFVFSPLLHETGDKVVLGKTIKSGGMDEGMQVLKMLAHHPSTARYVSTKLVRRFVADNPPAEIVDAGRDAFLKSGGDIRQTLAAILTHPSFFAAQYHQIKFKKPVELVWSALRAVDAEVSFPPMPRRRMMGQGATGLGAYMAEMGEALYQRRTPDGYPDHAAAWLNSNALLKRMEFANAVTAGEIPGVQPNLASARQLLRGIGMPQPSAEQLNQMTARIAQTGAAKKPAQPGGESMMMDSSKPQKMETEKKVSPEALTVAFALGSPQFQKR